jgi:transposase
MFSVEVYAKIRRAVLVDGMTRRAASRLFGVHRNTIAKMLAYSVPPGYRRKVPRVSVKLEGFTKHIDAMLESDRGMGAKQRHTCKRVFDRLREEHHYTGGLTIVHEYVRSKRRRMQEVFVPLSHRPGHAQADFGEADALLGGKRMRVYYLCIDIPHSDACFVKAYLGEVAEAWCDGHVDAFAFFGGVPLSILYDNSKRLVAQISAMRIKSRGKIAAPMPPPSAFTRVWPNWANRCAKMMSGIGIEPKTVTEEGRADERTPR